MTKTVSKTHSMPVEKSDLVPLGLELSPTAHLYLYSDKDSDELLSSTVADNIREFFKLDGSAGLLRLGLSNIADLPPSLAFWHIFAQKFIAQVCRQSNVLLEQTPIIMMPTDEIEKWMATAPFMRGAEYLTLETVTLCWARLLDALIKELTPFDGNLSPYLEKFHAAWSTVGRVCFHLAENKANTEAPFAFLATYTTRLSNDARALHVPLGRALEEYSGQQKKSELLSLLLPVQKASENSIFLKGLVDAGSIFKPLAWTAQEAYQFLKDIPLLETAGVMVRVPNWWNPKKPSRPRIAVSIGQENVSQVGLDALLDFNLHFALPNGEELTSKEFHQLLNNTEKLVQIKGQWVEVDNEKLNQVLTHWETIEGQVKHEGLSFSEGLRLLAGIQKNKTDDISPEVITNWSTTVEGPWLHETLERLRHPEQSGEKKIHLILKKYLNASLRPYQHQGLQWLWWLYNMRLGGCLADDMGLGKTIQVISLLLLIKHQRKNNASPHLLILPASLLGNWQNEMARFAPDLRFWIAHTSANREEKPTALSNIDLVITTYGTLPRLPWTTETQWDCVILDEAQAIKNPSAKQTQAIKLLKSNIRFILTGTPIENRVLDLWSLFDFIAPGLLGSSRAFRDYGKQNKEFYAGIRRLVSPYILRRLKSDKKIIGDLPDKTELQTYCNLTKNQVGLYHHAVNELATKLEEPVEGIQRRGLVLSYLMRFKQICNHPSQWLGHGNYDPEMSGKFARLKELCEVIAEKQEKVLVFTQFREIIPALCHFLSSLFQREGLFLHGQVPVKERAKRVEVFSQENGPPFFVLSLKAGGTGLNLTAASHVIHFDRWWNPAVENQATDRAYRIGQQKNVLVHKLICRGTIEEKIDALINMKKSMSDEIMNQGGEALLTELSNDELLKVVSLDIHRALGEE